MTPLGSILLYQGEGDGGGGAVKDYGERKNGGMERNETQMGDQVEQNMD